MSAFSPIITTRQLRERAEQASNERIAKLKALREAGVKTERKIVTRVMSTFVAPVIEREQTFENWNAQQNFKMQPYSWMKGMRPGR